MVTFKGLSDVLADPKFIWEENFQIWDYFSYLIKYRPELFNICIMVDIPPSQYYVHFGISKLCIIIMKFFKWTYGGDGVFSVDSSNPENFLRLFRK